ncbi:MAG: hypothetical protein AB7L65_10985 [Hyphomonadaceae bacterium]
MKVLVGAAIAAFLMSSPVMAQTPAAGDANATTPAAPAAAPVIPPSRCPPLPAEPTLPEGASANAQRMQSGDRAYQSWGHTMQSVLECRRVEAEELLVYARQHEARVSEYNAAVSHLNSVGANWQAQVTAYNERNGRR